MFNNYWFEAVNINCFKNDYKVINDLNLKLNYSDNVAVIGPNGSGKSSIIELINRNIYPLIDERTVLKIFNKELVNLWELRNRISTVNTEIKKRIDPNLKIVDLIISGLYGKYCFINNKTNKDISIAMNLLDEMNLSYLSQKCYSYISDGEKQIALIARALINKPEIIILDEPGTNLDYRSKFYVVDKINELSNFNTKFFCVTHDISFITSIYDRIIMLKNGSIIADGSQKEVINSENINKLFDINIEIDGRKGAWSIKRKSK